MVGIYDIFRGGEKIGKAEVSKEGLYYRFRCCCDLTGEVMYRLTVTCGMKTENLGIPVPDGNEFVLSKRVPVSHFSAGTPEFRAIPKHEPLPEKWMPLIPETPFDYIARLENSLAERETGIFISDEVPQDNDPNP